MIEFVLTNNSKVSVNSKHILIIRPKRKDIFCNITVITLTNGTYMEVASSYDEVLKTINKD